MNSLASVSHKSRGQIKCHSWITRMPQWKIRKYLFSSYEVRRKKLFLSMKKWFWNLSSAYFVNQTSLCGRQQLGFLVCSSASTCRCRVHFQGQPSGLLRVCWKSHKNLEILLRVLMSAVFDLLIQRTTDNAIRSQKQCLTQGYITKSTTGTEM